LAVREGFVFSGAGWIFTRDMNLLRDFCWYGEHTQEMVLPETLPSARKLSGSGLTLLSDFASNYGHFVLDSLSRLALVVGSELPLREFDFVLCPRPVGKNAERMFESLEIPESKIVWATEVECVTADVIFCPTFPGARRNYPNWVPKYLQQAFLNLFPGIPSTKPRRLYVSRRGYRRNVANEETVNAIMRQRGFEIYDPGAADSSPADFAHAGAIVGPHGGALTDLAFCRPGTKVLELIPTDHIYPYFYTLSEATGLDYGYMLCPSTQEREVGARGPSPFDFTVDESELSAALDKLMRRA
jgi:capsular polysaccharide biosynthesis protein